MKLKNQILIVMGIVAITFGACNKSTQNNSANKDAADAIYFGGDIITMEGSIPSYAEAVAVKNGKIVFVGSKTEADKLKGDSTKMNDLKGKTLLPGFIDSHSHFINSLSMTSQANCFASPVGKANDVIGIIAALKELQTKNNVPKGEIISGYGYDENQMPEGKLLNRDDLDKAFPDNPVIVGHVSLHGAVLNSLALDKFGYSDKTVTPDGGIIIRKPGTNEPYGLIMETAFIPVFSNLPKPTPEQQMQGLKDGQMIYAEAGVTTAQEGATHKSDLDILINGAKQNAMFIDVVSYPFILDLDNILKDHPFSEFGVYKNNFKIGGVKITADGSPQGKTAFFTTPYLTGGPSGEKNWVGEPGFPQDSLNAWFKKVYDAKVQLLVHANGDAAMDMILEAHKFTSGNDSAYDRRTTVIHSQFVRLDQLNKYKTYNIIPSMYAEHTFFFGDTHVQNRGIEQASFISPLNTAIKLNLQPTNHTDFNVLPIDQMMVVWCAVNRTTRTGVILGADERITPYQALQCITINGAHQYFEESSKGSLKSGKRADLVILDKNPVKVDPLSIKDIKVLETIKDGKTVYKMQK
ncbi:MAG TPA: amidohydrolase [Ignavibacteria bacterium]|nr:amidohydrolase [Ignavibacteria bacterium]